MGKLASQGLFQANVELLRLFLTRRGNIVERVEAVLDAEGKPIRSLQDQAYLARQFDDCFFAGAAVTSSQKRLRRQLEEAHWSAGFRPRQVQGLYNDLIHPVEMMMRGFYCWHQTRWPAHDGRIHYAHTLFNLYVLRALEFLSMRLWDEDSGNAVGRLREIQSVLAELWRGSPSGQPVIVRDARWLIPLAQSQITDELAPYLDVARLVTETLPEADAIEIQRAHVRMLGGHLTSQIRYDCMREGASMDEQAVVLRTRTSNALDFALLVQGLVALLKVYEVVLQSGDEPVRFEMAGAICQGISSDPELFLNRVDLLGAYSMMEHVFIAPLAKQQVGKGAVVYSPLGQRHVRLLEEYGTLIARLSKPLRDDLLRFKPVGGGCSPYGIIFGLPSNLIENMALKATQPDAEARFSLEDVFEDRDTSAAKLAWVNGWRELPHIDREVQRLYEYPQQFAEEIYHRIESELQRCDGSRTGRLYLVSGDDTESDLKALEIPKLRSQYFVSSDEQVVAAHKAEPYDQTQLLAGRQEGHFLVSYQTRGGWIALKKELLTKVLGAGRDAKIAGLPLDAAQVLRLMCPGLVMPENGADAGRKVL